MSQLVKKVFFDYPAENATDALEFLSEQAVKLGIADDAAAVLAAFQAREAQGPTGMTGGFAIPHAKSNAVKEPAIIVVTFDSKVEWKSMEGHHVRAAIAIFVPEDQAAEHLAILAKVAGLIMQPDFCEKVLTSSSAKEITRYIDGKLAD